MLISSRGSAGGKGGGGRSCGGGRNVSSAGAGRPRASTGGDEGGDSGDIIDPSLSSWPLNSGSSHGSSSVGGGADASSDTRARGSGHEARWDEMNSSVVRRKEPRCGELMISVPLHEELPRRRVFFAGRSRFPRPP